MHGVIFFAFLTSHIVKKGEIMRYFWAALAVIGRTLIIAGAAVIGLAIAALAIIIGTSLNC